MIIELRNDGGILIKTPGRTGALVTAAAARELAASAADKGEVIHITGDVESPPGRAIVELLKPVAAGASITPSTPAPWSRGWSSLQVAAVSGFDDVVRDLLARGASMELRRRDHSPYRLAMRHGYFDVMRTLRDAGAKLPRGLKPPDELPNAVVARNYVPVWTWWVMLAIPLPMLAIGIIADELWNGLVAFLVVAGISLLFVFVANAIIGRIRIAVDGPYVSVRQNLRWQGPIDLRRLVSLGYVPWRGTRFPACWMLVQREAGQTYRWTRFQAIEGELIEQLRADTTLRAIAIYCGVGHGKEYLWPGLPRHLAAYVLDTQAGISTGARTAFAKLGLRAADVVSAVQE